MKSLYLLKTLLPFIVLPIAPSMLQIELVHQGLLSQSCAVYAIVLEALLTVCMLAWARRVARRRDVKGVLRMSCVSKKVYHRGVWISVEQYLRENHNVVVTHGFTPEESEAWLAEARQYLLEENPALELTETAV